MKTRIIITAVMAVLLGSNGAMAGNTVDAYQKNSNNNLTVTQSGVSPSSIAIDQNGYDTATIDQAGATNTIGVVQDQSSVTTPQSVNITQANTSSSNVANVYQTTLATPPASIGNGVNTGGTAQENTATVFQYGTSSTATITQSGNTNPATISQDSNSTATISQTGSGNVQAIIDQTSGTVTASFNTASITQDGTASDASITQSTNNNTATIVQDASSSGLVASITQGSAGLGQFNIATVTQSNASNSVTVTQDGDGIGAGTENTITITQAGLLGDTATATQHTGDSNQITINQNRGDGSVVNITQDGSSNTANVTQN